MSNTDQAALYRFTVGGVLGATFGVLFRNLGGFVILAVLINLGIYLIEGAIGADTSEPGMPAAGADLLLNLVGYSFLSALVSFGTYRDLRGDRAPLGQVVSRGFRVLLPVIGVSIVVTIAYLVGFFLLIVPGIVAIVWLWVAVPAAVVERPGVFGAIRRSLELTKGERWRIFGLLVLFVASLLILMLVGGVYGMVVGMNPELTEAEMSAAIDGPMEVAGTLFGVVLSLIASISVAVSYFLLRSQKEGVAVGDLAGVFD